MNPAYLKIPCEMALFALREQQTAKAGSYLATHFIYSGKAPVADRPANRIAQVTGVSPRTVHRHFEWLLERNWLGKDDKNGWYFFRGLDRVHRMEGWKYGRAALMQKKDLQNIKAFFAGVVMASLAQTGKGQRTERQSPRSKPTAAPISLSVLSDTLQVSESTAYRLRKLADDKKYIKNEERLIQITNWRPEDIKQVKASDVDKVPVQLLGYADRKIVPVERIRYKDNKLFLQEPNMVYPLIHLKARRGLLNTAPYGGTNVSQK